jgi:hypothetical protein
MSEHDLDLLDKVAGRIKLILWAMGLLIAGGAAGGGWLVRQEYRLAGFEKEQQKMEVRLEGYQASTSQKFESLLSSQSQILIALAEVRIELRTINERLERELKKDP